MIKKIIKEGILWGLFLWVVGYGLGIVLFPVVPLTLIGWVIMPVGIIITLLVLFKKIKGDSIKFYLILSIIWTFIAVILDYFLLVKLFKSSGYYKLDVYLYYFLTFILPIFAGWEKIYLSSKKVKN